jgi:DNA polymerase
MKYLDAIGIQVWEERAPQTVQVLEDFNTPIEADDLAQLYAIVDACTHCEASHSRNKVVFNAGPAQADWMVVGGFPSQSDDMQGRPYTDVSGRLLDDMLLAIGVKRQAVYVTTSVKCHSADGQEPAANLLACRQYLIRQIELVQPSVVLVFGEQAAKSLLATSESMTELRGKLHVLDGISASIIVSQSLDDLLKTPLLKKQAWEDLTLAKNSLN